MPEKIDLLLMQFVCPKSRTLSFYPSCVGSFQNTIFKAMLELIVTLISVMWNGTNNIARANKRIICSVTKTIAVTVQSKYVHLAHF